MCEKTTFAISFHNELQEFVTCTLNVLSNSVEITSQPHYIIGLITELDWQ